MKQNVAILDFGTSKITVLIGSRGINNSICIDGIGVCEYAGYAGGMWLEPENLPNAIAQAIAGAETSARVEADRLYIGVPNDFSKCVVGNNMISLSRRRRVTAQDVSTLFDSGNKFDGDPEWEPINIQAIYYTLDDDRKLVEPVGMVTTKLGGSISYMLARKDFVKTVKAAALDAGVRETEFVSASLAEMLFLFDDYRRDNCVLLADVGALGTAFSIGRGDGLCRQYYFSWGGARITDALAQKFEISLREAEKLKHKVVLSLAPEYVPPEDTPPVVMQTEYDVEIDSEIHSYDVTETNDTVRLEIERLARYIEKALKYCDYEYPEFTPLSITGGGLNYIRGAAEYLAECLGREVEAVKPGQPMMARPQLSSALGLLDIALNDDAPAGGIFHRLRRLLSKQR